MANSLHVTVVRKGAGAIHSFRHVNPEIQLDLESADLRNVDLKDANLTDANLRLADLRGVCLIGANLHGATLVEADLENADLANATITKANLSDANLRGTNLTSANMAGADLRHTNLRESIPFSFGTGVLSVIRTIPLSEEYPRLPDANLSELDLSHLQLKNIDLQNVNLTGANLADTDLGHANLTLAILKKANLSLAYLFSANLHQADLRAANLPNGTLVSADLSGADISAAKMLGAKIDSTTNLRGITCYRSIVDRSTAEYLQASGTTVGQLMDLTIVDDLATLRGEFSGIWGAIHVISILVFLLPYAWFLAQQSIASSAIERADSAITSLETWAKERSGSMTFISAEAFKAAVDSKIKRTSDEWREQLKLRDLPGIASTTAETTLCTAETWARSQADHIAFVSAETLKMAADRKIERTAKGWREQLKLKEPKEISVRTALLRYIWNGGNRWSEGYFFNGWSFVPFAGVAVYSILRLILLYKTKRLETLEAVRGLPVVFSLGTGWWSWRTLYRLNRVGYWLSILLVVKNTIYFLNSPIRI